MLFLTFEANGFSIDFNVNTTVPLATAWSLFTKASMYCACAVQSCSGSMLRLSCHNRICGNQNKLVASTLIVALQIQLSMLH